MKEETHPSSRQIPTSVFLILLLVGLLIRLALLPTEGFQDDVSLWQNWALKIRKYGFSRVYDPVWELPSGEPLGGVNHPPTNLLYLSLVSSVITELPYLHPASNFLVKLPGLVFDLLVVGMFIVLARMLGYGGWGRFVALMYWLSPAIIYHGAFWGLNESVSAFIWLVTLYLLLTKRFVLALAIAIGSTAIKLQNVIFLPIVFLTVLLSVFSSSIPTPWERYRGVREGLVRVMRGGLLGLCILTVFYTPFILEGTHTQAFQVLTDSIGYFPSLTKGAFNVWYLVDGATHFSLVDSELALGALSYRTIGIALFVIATLVNCFIAARSRFHPKTLVTAFVIQGFSFFMLPTEMHERYIFYAIPFLPLLVFWGTRGYWLYGAVSFLYLFNLVAVYNDYYGNFHIPLGCRYAVAGLYLVCYVMVWYWYARESSQTRIMNKE